MNVRELKHEHAALVTESRAMVEAAEREARGLTVEERSKYDSNMEKITTLAADIERLDKLAAAEQRMNPGKIVQENANIGLSDQDVQRFGFMRAVRASANKDWRGAEFEKEVSDAVAKKLGYEPRGFFVPQEWLKRRERRDMTVGTPTAGGYFKATDFAPSFIDMLYNRALTLRAGATVIDGLVGDFAIPSKTGSSTAYWVTESGAPTESTPATGQVLMQPKTVGSYIDLSRKFIKQSSFSAERFAIDDLARVVGIEIDRAALHGSAVGAEPRGIVNVSGIGVVYAGGASADNTNANGAAAVWADVVNLEKEVAIDNADTGALAYMTNPKVRGLFKRIFRNATYGEIPVWMDGATPLNGYPAWVTNQVTSTYTKGGSGAALSQLFFGNWQDLIVGQWGGLDVLVDPYTGSNSGTMRVVALQDVDIAVRHASSFAVCKDIVAV